MEKTVDLKIIQFLCSQHRIRWTAHMISRLIQRGLSQFDVENAIMTGKIIEQYPDDYPVPSCLILGKTNKGKYVHVCCSSDGNYVWMITAYIPDSKSWNETFDRRKYKSGENNGK